MKKDLEILAIIPARGGSKGIPRKNIKHLAGIPLVGHTIGNCIKSKRISRTVVSTDDQEIAKISEQFGAEVVQRPYELSGDSEPSESALMHVLQYLAETENYTPDLIVFLQCTSPLILPNDIDGAVQTLIDTDADVAFAATKSHLFLWEKDSEGRAKALNHDESFRPMRQTMHSQFRETGAVYAMKAAGFLKAKHRFFGKISLHEIPQDRSIDIDDPNDLLIAEVILRERQRKNFGH